jgi:DNA repair exonuclease SbcCD ATPase subunit
VGAQARQFEEMVQQRVAELAGERHRIQEDLQAREQATATHFQQVAESMNELQQLADGRLQGTRSHIAALREAVEKGRAALEQAEDRLQQEMGEAEAAARAQASAYVAGIEALLKEQTVALVGLANALVASHNKAVVDLRQKFAEAVPAALSTAADDLKVAIQRVDQLCENQSAPIQQRTVEITKVVGEALHALERIRTAAASAGAL